MTDPTFTLPTIQLADGGTLDFTGVIHPSTVPDPDPPVDPPDGPPVVLPKSQRRILWHHGWAGKPLLTLPSDVRIGINTISCLVAQSAQSGTGNLTAPSGVDKATVTSLTASGIDVLIGIGGASDGGITITTPAQVTQARDSINALIRDYGYIGIDLDLEPSGSKWTEASLVNLVSLLKSDHPNFVVGLTVALYSPHTAGWLSLAKALGSNLSFFAVMCYDFVEAKTSALTSVVVNDKLPKMTTVVPAAKCVVLYMPYTPNHDNTSPVPVLVAAQKAAIAKFSGVGFGIYEDLIDGANGFPGIRALFGL